MTIPTTKSLPMLTRFYLATLNDCLCCCVNYNKFFISNFHRPSKNITRNCAKAIISHRQNKINFALLCNNINALKMSTTTTNNDTDIANNIEKGNAEKFVVLSDEYIKKFDEIVIIGDIHGCNEEFEELMSIVHTGKNPNSCLKILVGDLINKGPLNRKVLDNCCVNYKDSIIAVRGNHDECVLREREKFDKNLDDKWPSFGWVKELPKEYIDYLSNLPYTIRIPSFKCIIVHAGLNPFLAPEEAACKTPLKMMVSMRNAVPETKEITKDHTVGKPWAELWQGPDFVYFGHDARRRLQDNLKFALGLDTGCVYGDRLTGVYIKGDKKGQLITVKAKKVYQHHDE